MKRIIAIHEPPTADAGPRGFALWELGFRPFYLLAAVFATLSIPLWVAQFAGWVASATLSGPLWHAHEMLFGYTLAVIVGFLFTAGRSWTGRTTPHGAWLAALATLWVAGRVLVLTPYAWTAAVVDSAFPVAAAFALARPFWAARSRRNYLFVGLLVAMGAANFAIHLSALQVFAWPPFAGIRVALDVVLIVMTVIGGRVIPMFTNSGVRHARATLHPVVERATLASTLLLAVADLAQLDGTALAVVTIGCAFAHASRWVLWQSWKTTGAPMVWVLHAAYAWIPIHLALRSAAALGWVGSSAATHALTAGAIGGLTIGMMTRTTKGHTGRPLKADRIDVACYALIACAAMVRVWVPMVAPAWTLHALTVSSLLWSTGFAVFVAGYGPLLVRPRLDGRG